MAMHLRIDLHAETFEPLVCLWLWQRQLSAQGCRLSICIVVFLSVIAVVVHYLVVEARPNRSRGFIASMRRWRRR